MFTQLDCNRIKIWTQACFKDLNFSPGLVVVCTGTAMLTFKRLKSFYASWWIAAVPSLRYVPTTSLTSLVPFPGIPGPAHKPASKRLMFSLAKASRTLLQLQGLRWQMCVGVLEVLLPLTTLPCSSKQHAEYCLTSLGQLRMNEKRTSQLINETAIWDQIRNAVEA